MILTSLEVIGKNIVWFKHGKEVEEV